ncbi:hypothetical protein [Sphingomonas sp.]|uniref:hypothetical protein n=1 Tax=Sphingomonas sp. TaxID=28214 RepID=UPI003B00CB2B
MDRQADSENVCGERSIAGERASPSRLVRTDIPERLSVLPDESDLVLQHLGEALADIFSP